MKSAAIQTVYRGYKFRSRLEARWAVFFDALGVKFDYEKEGFYLDDGSLYLPDFFLPEIRNGLWIEVKGDPAQLRESYSRAEHLALATGFESLVVLNDPMTSVDAGGQPLDGYWIAGKTKYNGVVEQRGAPNEDIWSDSPYVFCVCPWCEKIGVEYDGRGARVCGYRAHYADEDSALAAIKHLGHWRVDDKCYTHSHQKIVEAALSARQARFEHGETPVPA